MEEVTKREQISNKCEVPIWIKQNLTLEEATAYFGIGQTKIKQMTNSEAIEEAAAYSGVGRTTIRELTDQAKCPFVIWMDGKRYIIREHLDKYLNKQYKI